MKKGFATFFILIFVISCSPFSRFSKTNQYLSEKCPDSKTTIRIVSNQELGISTITFGDFKFANSQKEFKAINPSAKSQFKNILFYGITDDYEYYVLLNFEGKLPENYISRDTIIGENQFVLVASNSIHEYDFNYLKKHIYTFGTNLTENVCF